MNDTENLEKSNDLNTDNNEAISNLIQNIQSKLNGEINNTQEKCNIDNTDINNTAEDKSNFDIGKIIGMLGSLNSGSENADFNLGNLDPKLFSKIQQIVISIGKKDPKKDLLISLKPFLRKSRQDKISEYITILTIIKAFEAFNDKGSDKNV